MGVLQFPRADWQGIVTAVRKREEYEKFQRLSIDMELCRRFSEGELSSRELRRYAEQDNARPLGQLFLGINYLQEHDPEGLEYLRMFVQETTWPDPTRWAHRFGLEALALFAEPTLLHHPYRTSMLHRMFTGSGHECRSSRLSQTNHEKKQRTFVRTSTKK